jgi:ribosomal protein S18 acetylase RimI-like enzyme
MQKLKIKKIDKELMQDFLEKNEYVRHIPKSMICYGCYEENEKKELVGVVGLYKIAWHTTEIRCLCVKKEERQKGIGKFIVSEVLEKVDTPLVVAIVEKNNTPSFKIFENKGFKVVETFFNKDTGHYLQFMLRVQK